MTQNCYFIVLLFMCNIESWFQNIGDLRHYLTYIDDDVTGERLPDRSYGEDCELNWENITVCLSAHVWLGIVP